MYIVWATQNGEGCDYTIGCGRNLYELEAETMEEAATEVQEMVVKTVSHSWAERYGEVVIYAVSGTCSVDAEALYKQEEKRLATLAAQEIEEKEKRLYERLRDKYQT